jgi:DNA processing protein
MNEEQLFYHILLTQIPHIGDVHIGVLLEYFNEPKNIFTAKKRELESLNGIGTIRANAIKNFKGHDTVLKELNFIHKNDIRTLVKRFNGYPQKMENYPDAPHVLFFKGSADLSNSKIVSIIGTRSPTEYGKERVVQLIESLSQLNILVVSGLAYGIDTCVHRESLRNRLPTLGVLGHGLDQIYPQANRSLAIEMLQYGGLITEFMKGTKPDKQNFPLRNRIVSGIADAVIVIESGEKGGSLITANMANAYNKDVFAFPGRSIDQQSMGCNELIKSQRAHLITKGDDLLQMMNWQTIPTKKTAFQSTLFESLGVEERRIIELLSTHHTLSVDDITGRSMLKPSIVSCQLLSLEMKGLLKVLPGKRYTLR